MALFKKETERKMEILYQIRKMLVEMIRRLTLASRIIKDASGDADTTFVFTSTKIAMKELPLP